MNIVCRTTWAGGEITCFKINTDYFLAVLPALGQISSNCLEMWFISSTEAPLTFVSCLPVLIMQSVNLINHLKRLEPVYQYLRPWYCIHKILLIVLFILYIMVS